MELWSNDRLTEFTIKLNSVAVVTTTSNPEAITKIDGCPYRSGYEFDWHYTLSQWVIYYLANKFTVYLTPKLQYKKSSIFETKKLTLVYTLLPIEPSR